MREGHWDRGIREFGGVAALALIGAAILGYHPYAEDGGIYVAEIKRALNPALYPRWTEFVSGHLGRSAFTVAAVWLVRWSGFRLDFVLAALHLTCLFASLLGVWCLAGRFSSSGRARWGAVGLVALCLGMPVAGTSLLVMDPYVTARSVAMPMTLLGIAAIAAFRIDRQKKRLVWGVAAMVGAAIVHPLMGGYGMVEAVALICVMDRRRWVRIGGISGLAAGGVTAAGFVQVLAAPETAEYVRVALTRYYWFLGEWQWFELIGLAAPLAILLRAGWRRSSDVLECGLAWMAVSVGGIAVGIAAAFAREAGRVHAVARMQPLRCFQMVYVVLLMLIGAWLGEQVLRGSFWRWSVAGLLLGGLMVYVQRKTYPASDVLELPTIVVGNRWEQAFLWVKRNTPNDALFALDADYVHQPGEDTQGFRAVAERSALPDYSKDGGQAAIRPELTNVWAHGQRAQVRLTEETDPERVVALEPYGVTWILIGREGTTELECPYKNERVKVCRLK